MSERKCAICGCDISNRNIQAKICLSRECWKKLNEKKLKCRFCGNSFMSISQKRYCSSAVCLAKRMELARQSKSGKANVQSITSKIKPDSPDSKYAVTYCVASKTATRGHAGTNFTPNEDAASSDCAWLFKGRTPEKPRPVLDVSKSSGKVRGWRQAHKEQFELHKMKKSATI